MIETGWYKVDDYNMYVTTRKINDKQTLYFTAYSFGRGDYIIALLINDNCLNPYDILHWDWDEVESTNTTPSFSTLRLSIDCLKETEQAIITQAKGKRRRIYIGGIDEKRIRCYEKVLNKYNFGYKRSSLYQPSSNHSEGKLPILVKIVFDK